MTKPFFSIITCTRNSARYIQKNIRSVSAQTYTNFEHILIDGDSTDGTREIIDTYITHSPHTTTFYTQEPRGISHAMNKGVQVAKGTYIIHLHSDDSFYNTTVLEEVHKHISARNNPDWVYGQIHIMRDSKPVGIFPTNTLWKTTSQSYFGTYILKLYNFIPHQAVFIKRDVLEKNKYFNKTLRCHMDLDMWLRIRTNTCWSYIPTIVSNYALRDDAQSSGKRYQKDNAFEKKRVLRSHLNIMEYTLSQCIAGIIYIYTLCKKK